MVPCVIFVVLVNGTNCKKRRVDIEKSLSGSAKNAIVTNQEAGEFTKVNRILGKCTALWGKPRTLLRLSQRSTELSCTMKRDRKKSKAIDEQRCGTAFFFVDTSAHARVRLSYEFRL